MGKRTNLTQQQIDSLAASFYPTIKAYFASEEGRAEYQKYLDKNPLGYCHIPRNMFNLEGSGQN